MKKNGILEKMKKRIRRVFLFIISILFLGIATIVVMTGIGYVFDFQHGRIQLTGAISLRSIPSDAFISFNGKKIDQRTPDLITRIKPGEYSVSVFKPGLIPWTKIVRVTSKKTEIFDSIRLFRDDIASETIRIVQPYTVILPSHGGDKILSIEKENGQSNIALVKRNTEPIILGRFDELIDPENIQWSFDDQRMVIPVKKNNGVDLEIVSVNPSIPKWRIADLFGEHVVFQQWQWSDIDPEILMASDQQHIFLINTVLRSASKLLSHEKRQWVMNKNRIGVWTGTSLLLYERSDGALPPIRISTALDHSFSSDFTLVSLIERLVVFQNKKNEQLKFFLIENGKMIEFPGLPEGKNFQWSKNEQFGMLWNDHELWLIDGKSGQTRLLTRSSGIISTALWVLEDRAITFQVEDAINVVSFDRGMESFTIVELPKSGLGILFGESNHSKILLKKSDGSRIVISEQTIVPELGFDPFDL